MHHPTDRITHTTAFVTPVVEHWLERLTMLVLYYNLLCHLFEIRKNLKWLVFYHLRYLECGERNVHGCSWQRRHERPPISLNLVPNLLHLLGVKVTVALIRNLLHGIMGLEADRKIPININKSQLKTGNCYIIIGDK